MTVISMAAGAVPVRRPELESEQRCVLGCGDTEPCLMAPDSFHSTGVWGVVFFFFFITIVSTVISLKGRK